MRTRILLLLPLMQIGRADLAANQVNFVAATQLMGGANQQKGWHGFDRTCHASYRISAASSRHLPSFAQASFAPQKVPGASFKHSSWCFAVTAMGEQKAGWEAQASHLDPGPYYLFGINVTGAQVHGCSPRHARSHLHHGSLRACASPIGARTQSTELDARARDLQQLTLSAVSAQVGWPAWPRRAHTGNERDTLISCPTHSSSASVWSMGSEDFRPDFDGKRPYPVLSVVVGAPAYPGRCDGPD